MLVDTESYKRYVDTHAIEKMSTSARSSDRAVSGDEEGESI